MHNVVRFWKSSGLLISFFAQRDLRSNKQVPLNENQESANEGCRYAKV
jgi:hypothetical protein